MWTAVTSRAATVERRFKDLPLGKGVLVGIVVLMIGIGVYFFIGLRIAAEKAAQEEADRVAQQKAAQEEADRVAQQKAAQAEADRVAAQKAAEKAEAERKAAAAAQAEADRVAKQKAHQEETDRVAATKADTSNRLNMLKEIRSQLFELNFDPGKDLTQAIRDFEKTRGIAETGKPTAELLQRLRAVQKLTPWGAIVYAPRGRKWGMSWSKGTRLEAVVSARAKCGTPKRCPEEVSFFGSDCGVFAHSSSGWGIAESNSIEQAKEKAVSGCRKRGRSCDIVASVCANGAERYESR